MLRITFKPSWPLLLLLALLAVVFLSRDPGTKRKRQPAPAPRPPRQPGQVKEWPFHQRPVVPPKQTIIMPGDESAGQDTPHEMSFAEALAAGVDGDALDAIASRELRDAAKHGWDSSPIIHQMRPRRFSRDSVTPTR
jgi:hypothetical protein